MPRSRGESLTQIAYVPFHTPYAAFHMTRKRRLRLCELQKHIFLLDISKFAQHTADAGTDVTGAHQKAISVFPAGIHGIMTQCAVKEQEEVKGGHRPPRMAASRKRGAYDDALHAAKPHFMKRLPLFIRQGSLVLRNTEHGQGPLIFTSMNCLVSGLVQRLPQRPHLLEDLLGEIHDRPLKG